ncbi:hypothetical protein PG989_009569 [Apiospora arundinis]
MPKQTDPPSPSKPVPASWWFLTGGVGPPPRTQAAFHRLASERKAAHRAEVTEKQQRKDAEKARKEALAKLEEEHKAALAKLEEEHGSSRLVGKVLQRQPRKRLGRKQLMEKYGPESSVKTGRGVLAMGSFGNVAKPQAEIPAGDSGDQAPAVDTGASDEETPEAGADSATVHTAVVADEEANDVEANETEGGNEAGGDSEARDG